MSLRTKDTVFNAAILTCGLRPGDETGVWEALEANYPEIVREAFSNGGAALPFGRHRIVLQSRTNGELGYDDAFKFAANILHINEVYLDGVSAADLQEPWEIYGAERKLVINARERKVEVEVIKEGQEDTWSPSFARAIQKKLEAVIKEVLEETEEAKLKDQEAEEKLLRAGVRGSKSRSQNSFRKHGSGRLMRARTSVHRRWGR